MLTEGKKAPAFTLMDKDGVSHKLSDYLGKWVFIYFYPKDNTPGCTKEACAIRDEWSAFKKMGVQVFGVSTDSQKSHEKFAEKFDLPFILLADEDKKVVEKYGVWGEKKMMGRTYMGTNRMSFLIDPKGKIVKIYEKVKPAIHAQEVLQDLQTLMV